MTEIPHDELEYEFLRASGPGGQNVNKVETAVRLRFDVRASRVLPEAVKLRLLALAGRRATRDGVIVIVGRRFREREKNRIDVLLRLEGLVERAERPPRRRRATAPSRAARLRRRKSKARRAETKAGRRPPAPEE
ncbi:MAG: aminoacyl-tRNA hydrolase [Acidobacteria bacterium]|nr:aminoacyl-tRNA hydrolase [Acidobacteriota bacterium]